MLSNNFIDRNTPEHFLCPITQEIMTDPVIAADGQTYDRNSITEWLSRGNRRSPLNGSTLSTTRLLDNIFARISIREHQSIVSVESQQSCVKSNLEKCILQKEEMIKSLIEKIDQINIIQANTNTSDQIDTEYDFNANKEIIILKKQIHELDEVNLHLKKENLSLKKLNHELEENNFDVKKENLSFKNQIHEIDSVNFDLKKEILTLKKQIHELEESNFELKKENLKLVKKSSGNDNIPIPPVYQKKQLEKNNPIPLVEQSKTPENEINLKHNSPIDKSPYSNDILKFSKSCSLQMDGEIRGLLDHNDGTISCFTNLGIRLLKIKRDKLKLVKTFPIVINFVGCAIQQKENIIFKSKICELSIFDRSYKLIQFISFNDEGTVEVLCSLSEIRFALGLSKGTIKIYNRNLNNKQYEITNEYRHDSNSTLNCLLYLSKKNYLVSNSYDHFLRIYNLNEKKLIVKHRAYANNSKPIYETIIGSLIQINDETFISGEWREIRIWSIKNIMQGNIECIKTIKTHENSRVYYTIDLKYNGLGNDYMVSKSENEFFIWDVKNFSVLNSFKEESTIYKLILSNNNVIITGGCDNKVNIWNLPEKPSECIIY